MPMTMFTLTNHNMFTLTNHKMFSVIPDSAC